MARTIRATSDLDRLQLRRALSLYKQEHAEARIDVKRQNLVSLRVRVVDPNFAGMNLVERDEVIWKILKTLPARVQSQITMVLLLTPQEAVDSFANLEFDHPVRSKL